MPLELNSIDQFDFHKSPVYGICTIDNHIFSVSGDRQVIHYWLEDELWKAETIALLNHAGYCCHAEKYWLFVGDAQGQLYQFDLRNKSLVKIIEAHHGGIFKLTDEQDELISIGQDGKLNVWKLENLEMIRTIWISDQKLRDVQWDQNKEKLAIVGQDGFLRILTLPLYQEVYTSKVIQEGLSSAAFWASKHTWITGSKSGKINFWKEDDTASKFEFQAHKGNIYRLIVDEKHDLLWSISIDKTLKAWDLKDLALAGKWENLEGSAFRSINDLAIFNDDILVSCGDNKKIDVLKICFSE